LIDFLNEVLPVRHRIRELTYARNEQLGDKALDRKAIFDLYCVGENGDRFIVEMQKAKQNYFKDRTVYYASFPIQEQARKGEWDYRLSAVYLVGILDFIFSEDAAAEEVRHEIQLKDQHCRVFYDKLTYIYLEMPHFKKTAEELRTNFDKWLFVLQQLPYLQSRPPALQEKVFQRLFEAAEIARFDKTEKMKYEESLKYYRDLKNVVDTSFDEGKAEGLAEGLTKGKAEGLAEGLTKGKSEGKAEGKAEVMAEIARRLKQEGESVERIVRLTGLTTEEIGRL
ncbi:MAG: hypothetical protein RLY31_103, partial [Bacteroidota bacterium]